VTSTFINKFHQSETRKLLTQALFNGEMSECLHWHNPVELLHGCVTEASPVASQMHCGVFLLLKITSTTWSEI